MRCVCVWHCQPAGIYPLSPQTIESKQNWWVRADSCCSCLRTANTARSSHTQIQKALECLFVVRDIKGSLSLIHSSWILGLSIAHRRRLHRHTLFWRERQKACVFLTCYTHTHSHTEGTAGDAVRHTNIPCGGKHYGLTDYCPSILINSALVPLPTVCVEVKGMPVDISWQQCVSPLDRRLWAIHTYV